MKIEIAFPKLKDAYKAVSLIRDLPDLAVWDIRVTPMPENRALVEVPQVLIDRQPSVPRILRSHGGIMTVARPIPSAASPQGR